jgi:uncharacterized protein YcbK (DUF882 family)
MISINELTHNQDIEPDHLENLNDLLVRLNAIRGAYGKPMTVTSGYRTMERHLNIYRKIAERKGLPCDESKVPMKSAHLIGKAADILDVDGSFNKWCLENEVILRDNGLWLENRQGPWQHLQSKPFGSYVIGGTIWFNP